MRARGGELREVERVVRVWLLMGSLGVDVDGEF